jgi:hypothetical protein
MATHDYNADSAYDPDLRPLPTLSAVRGFDLGLPPHAPLPALGCLPLNPSNLVH